MKYVILHGEGLSGDPLPGLSGRTALDSAQLPNLDRLAANGELGLLVLPGTDAGVASDCNQLALLGYEPRKHHSGRGAFEAAGLGVVLGDHDVAYRCTMVTLRGQAGPGGRGTTTEVKKLAPYVAIDDAQAGGIETEEARELIDSVNEQLGSESLQFYPGSGHRNLMVWVDGKAKAVCTDPEQIQGKAIGDYLPSGDGADILKQVMEAAFIILRDHPVNEDRRQAGKKPANCLWLWDQGRAPSLIKITDRYHLSGVVVAASDLHRGIGICAGLEGVSPETSASKTAAGDSSIVAATLRELEKRDLAYVHVEVGTQDECAKGQALLKKLQDFDQAIVGPLVEGLGKLGPFRLLVVADVKSPAVSSPSPGGPTVPYILCQGPILAGGSKAGRFSESEAAATKTVVRDATRLLPKLLLRT